jgi:hypothetical protein
MRRTSIFGNMPKTSSVLRVIRKVLIFWDFILASELLEAKDSTVCSSEFQGVSTVSGVEQTLNRYLSFELISERKKTLS